MDFWVELWHEIGITAPRAVGVILSAGVLYLAFTVILRVWGQRLFANRSGSGLAVVLVLGAIVGRSMLGPNATLLGGLLVLATLLILETDGTLSVLRWGDDVDPRLFTNVRGAERVLGTDAP